MNPRDAGFLTCGRTAWSARCKTITAWLGARTSARGASRYAPKTRAYRSLTCPARSSYSSSDSSLRWPSSPSRWRAERAPRGADQGPKSHPAQDGATIRTEKKKFRIENCTENVWTGKRSEIGNYSKNVRIENCTENVRIENCTENVRTGKVRIENCTVNVRIEKCTENVRTGKVQIEKCTETVSTENFNLRKNPIETNFWNPVKPTCWKRLNPKASSSNRPEPEPFSSKPKVHLLEPTQTRSSAILLDQVNHLENKKPTNLKKKIIQMYLFTYTRTISQK